MYSFSSRVRYSEVDERGTLSPAALLSYLQDGALFQSEALGVGVSHANEVGRRWLLAAWEVRIAELPRFTDEIVVSTWATSFKGLFAHRNFTLDRAGERLVSADSLWFMYDDETGRPMRPPAEEIAPYEADLRAVPLDMPPVQRRIDRPGAGVPMPPVAVTQAYIDTNHHVNNAQYVNIALGALSEAAPVPGGAAPLSEAVPARQPGPLRRLDVQYCTAARLGDTIYPRIHPLDDGWVVDLADEGESSYAVVRLGF